MRYYPGNPPYGFDQIVSDPADRTWVAPSPNTGNLIARLLAHQGMDVVVANDAGSARKKFSAAAPCEFAVLNAVNPGEHVRAGINAIREHNGATPIHLVLLVAPGHSAADWLEAGVSVWPRSRRWASRQICGCCSPRTIR